jgi:hypothetical protein
MNASTLTREPARAVRPLSRRVRTAPARPDRRLWKTDADKAFEAGVRWFLAVSRSA